jgi:Uma2 family endonuclease
MTDAASKPMTVAEFLTWNDGTDTRYGLVCGRVVAMAPVSPDHSINHRVADLGALESGLKRPCYVGIEAGMVRPAVTIRSTRPTSSSAARRSPPAWR